MITSRTAAQSQRSSADVGEQSATASRGQAVRVAWFAGLSVALGTSALVAGVSSALLPFILALGPTVIALLLAWREGDGALGRGGVRGRRDDIRRPGSRDATDLLLMSPLGGNRAVDLMIGPRR